jgi:hypothetical protein
MCKPIIDKSERNSPFADTILAIASTVVDGTFEPDNLD